LLLIILLLLLFSNMVIYFLYDFHLWDVQIYLIFLTSLTHILFVTQIDTFLLKLSTRKLIQWIIKLMHDGQRNIETE